MYMGFSLSPRRLPLANVDDSLGIVPVLCCGCPEWESTAGDIRRFGYSVPIVSTIDRLHSRFQGPYTARITESSISRTISPSSVQGILQESPQWKVMSCENRRRWRKRPCAAGPGYESTARPGGKAW